MNLLPLLLFPLLLTAVPSVSLSTEPSAITDAESNAARLYRQAGSDLRPLTKEENTLITDALRNNTTTPVAFSEQEASTLLAAYAAPLHFIKEASALSHCDWGHDYTKGMSISYAHAQPIITLSRLLCLQLRLQVKSGNFTDALATTRQILNIRQHLISERTTIIELLIQVSLNNLLLRTLANDLQVWPESSLLALKQQLSPPTTGSFSKAFQTESEIMSTHFEQSILPHLIKAPGSDSEKAKAILTAYLADIPKINALLQLPPPEALQKAEALRVEIKKQADQSPLSSIGLDAIVGTVEVSVKNDLLFALFQTAIDIRLHGPEAVEKSRDPYRGKPFGYQKSDSGFTLTSAFTDKDKPLSLTFR